MPIDQFDSHSIVDRRCRDRESYNVLDQRKMELIVKVSGYIQCAQNTGGGDRRRFGRGQRKLTASKASSKAPGCSFCHRHAAYHCLVSSFLSPPWHMSRQGRTDLSRKTHLFHNDRKRTNSQGTKRPTVSSPPTIRGTRRFRCLPRSTISEFYVTHRI